MIKSTILSITLLLAGALASILPAQDVTYNPNFAASDFSGIGANGGSATIRYDLVGSPSSSPFGASFNVTLNIGAFTLNPGAVSDAALSYYAPSLFSTPSSIGIQLGVNTSLMNTDGSDLEIVDLSGYPRSGNVSQDTATAGTLAQNGIIHSQYSMEMGTVAPIAGAGWTSSSANVFGTLASGGGQYGASPSTHLLDAIELYVPDGTVFGSATFYALLTPGQSINVNAYFVSSPVDPAASMNGINSATAYGPRFEFGALTFSPVPEPGGAALLMTFGVLALVRRRRLVA